LRRVSFPAEFACLFALAGCEARRAALREMAIDTLARVDAARFERLLEERQLLPLIGTRAIDTGGGVVPDEFRAAVTGAVAASRARALALEVAGRELVDRLAAHGIAAMPLKGPYLATAVHGDPGLREALDIDLLVSPDDLDAAVDVLVRQGFHPPADVRRANGLPDLHFGLRHETLPRVELHWRIHWYEREFSRDLLARARVEDGLLRPRDEDLATSLLLFYARDGFYGVRLAADIAAWWDRYGDGLHGAFLEEHALRYPSLAPAMTAAVAVAEQVTGVPSGEWLGLGATHAHRVSLATRLADWTQAGDPDQLRANVSLVSGLLGPWGSAPDFVRRELFLQGLSAAQRAEHVLKVSARYALALWRVRGTRPWVELPVGP